VVLLFSAGFSGSGAGGAATTYWTMGAGVVGAAADWRPRRRKKKMVAMRAARLSTTMGTATPIAIFVPWVIPPVPVRVGGGVVVVVVVVGGVLLGVG